MALCTCTTKTVCPVCSELSRFMADSIDAILNGPLTMNVFKDIPAFTKIKDHAQSAYVWEGGWDPAKEDRTTFHWGKAVIHNYAISPMWGNPTHTAQVIPFKHEKRQRKLGLYSRAVIAFKPYYLTKRIAYITPENIHHYLGPTYA